MCDRKCFVKLYFFKHDLLPFSVIFLSNSVIIMSIVDFYLLKGKICSFLKLLYLINMVYIIASGKRCLLHYLRHQYRISLRKRLRIKVTPDLHLTYSKNGGNLGLVFKMKNIACLSILLLKHLKYTYSYLFKFVLYSIIAFKAN